MSFDGTEIIPGPQTLSGRIWGACCRSAIVQNMTLRVHKFTFQWEIFRHLLVLILSVVPFFFSGERLFSILPIAVWIFYNVLFIIATRQANRVIPGFGKFKLTFQSHIEEFFSPKVLPIFSICFLLVVLSLSVTGHKLGGAPLCFGSCGECLASWSASVVRIHPGATVTSGCGYENGEELLSVYTMAQTSFLSFFAVVLAMAACMAWKVDKEDMQERKSAENWLKSEDLLAFHLREGIMKQCSAPASPVRPEGNAAWVFFGFIAALSFILLGWHNWEKLPPSYTYSLLIFFNGLIILLSTLILHVGFFGRLITLYRRNYERVACLTSLGEDLSSSKMDSWWNCRNFVLNEDLALDYDIGGLAVSATFVFTLIVFIVLALQTFREGYDAMLEPPGSYCGYASLYLTSCLIRIFTLATTTFEEQQRHIITLQKKCQEMLLKQGATSSTSLALPSDWDAMQAANKRDLEGGSRSEGDEDKGDIEDLAPVDEDDFFFSDEPEGRAMGGASTGIENRVSSPSLAQTISTGALKIVTSLSNLANSSTPQSQLGPTTPTERQALLKGSYRRTGSGGAAEVAVAAAAADFERSKGLGDSDSSAVPSGSLSGTGGGGPLQGARDVSTRKSVLPQIARIMTPSGTKVSDPPVLKRACSTRGTMESSRQALMEMASQIRKYDPYPCILGIPIMPALFTTSKFYIFISFTLIGTRMMISITKTF